MCEFKNQNRFKYYYYFHLFELVLKKTKNRQGYGFIHRYQRKSLISPHFMIQLY